MCRGLNLVLLDLLIQMLVRLQLANFILFCFKIYSRSYGYEKKFFIEQNKTCLSADRFGCVSLSQHWISKSIREEGKKDAECCGATFDVLTISKVAPQCLPLIVRHHFSQPVMLYRVLLACSTSCSSSSLLKKTTLPASGNTCAVPLGV